MAEAGKVAEAMERKNSDTSVMSWTLVGGDKGASSTTTIAAAPGVAGALA